jgi:hypothetical protein
VLGANMKGWGGRLRSNLHRWLGNDATMFVALFVLFCLLFLYFFFALTFKYFD